MTTIALIILPLLSLTFFLAYKKEKKEHRKTRIEVQYERLRIDMLKKKVRELERELSGGNDFRREEV